MNTEGRIQQTPRVVTPYSTSKNTTKIFKGLSILFKLKKKTNFSLEQLYKENPNFKNIDSISKNFKFNFFELCNFSNKIYLSSYLPLINNFYLTDIISKNSQVMSECSLLLNKKTNFLKKQK
jgi:NADH dehydrogenase/NADH:ubiquinone oxidoreductase subunit G